MKRLPIRILCGVCLAALGAQAAATDVYVVCSAGVSISATDVRSMYLGEKQFAGGVKLQLADNASLQSAFLEKVLTMDSGKYSAVWTKKSFRDGANPPVVKSTDAEILEYVKRTPGACGYISSPPPADATLAAKF
jgi:hypothetical protein